MTNTKNMLRRCTDFILKGRLQAMGTAFAIAFLPLIGGVSILIAMLVTLRKNAYEGALVFMAASLPIIFQYMAVSAEARTDIFFAMVALTLLGNLVMWFFAALLRRYGNWNYILEVALLFGILAVVMAHALCPDMQGWWDKQLTVYFSKTIDRLQPDLGASSQATQAQQLAQEIKQYATGFLAASVLLNALLQLVIARWWQAVIFNPYGLRDELQRIRLSYIVSGLFVLLLVLGYFGIGLALDVLPILYAIFALAGLSLVHSLLSFVKKAGWFCLILVYVGIIVLFPYSILVLAITALFDTGLDFRKRASRLIY